MKELTKICQDLTGNQIKISSIKKTSLYDIPYYITSNSRVTKFYNWRPRKKFLDIANDTYKWLLGNKYNLKKILLMSLVLITGSSGLVGSNLSIFLPKGF